MFGFFVQRRILIDFLHENIKQIYFGYLAAAFGSTQITSVYSIVDMAMMGQYPGPDGTAALTVAAQVWNVIYSLGLLTGIGGSVITALSAAAIPGITGRIMVLSALAMLALWGKKQEVVGEYGHVKR